MIDFKKALTPMLVVLNFVDSDATMIGAIGDELPLNHYRRILIREN